MFRSVREFADVLESAGELRRISASVSPLLELSEIADRVSKSPAPARPTPGARKADPVHHDLGGVALLFENVEGSSFPVLINAFGSYRRMEIALGCHGEVRGLEDGHTTGGFEGIAARIEELARPEPPRGLREALKKLALLASLRKITPREVRSAPCQEVLYLEDAVDLNILPIPRCWPLDGDLGAVGYPPDVNKGIPGVEWDNERIRGRYITFGGVHTIHPDDADDPRPKSHNIGMYRVQQLGPRHMAMHWHMHHDGAAHWRAWKEHGRPMPVAIALGGESVLPYAATAPLPPGISELLMAGFLNRGGIPLVRCRTVPLRVPANAEIVIEGYVNTEAGTIGFDPRGGDPLGPGAVFEGPFGDHTGFYSMPDRYPILEVTAITHRRDAIYPTTIVGIPPQEDYYMGKATERIFLPLLRTLIPDIVDYDLPMFGVFHDCAFIRIRKSYPFHARRVMHAVWGAGQMAWTKNIVVVDEDVDVHDPYAVLRRVAEHCDPVRDTETVHGPLDILDHASPRLGVGAKLGFDATRKIENEDSNGIPVHPGEEPRTFLDGAQARDLLRRVGTIDGVTRASMPEQLANGWLFVQVNKVRAHQARAVIDQILRASSQLAPAYIVVVGPDANPDDPEDVLFHWCANTANKRDVIRHPAPSGADHGLAWYSGHARTRMAFNATPKTPEDEIRGLPVRPWPPIIRMTDDIRRRVTERWHEYGLE